MTPAEIVAAREIVALWMEPKPAVTDRKPRSLVSDLGWWWLEGYGYRKKERCWIPRTFRLDSLDALREVEARLTDEQWWKYGDIFNGTVKVAGFKALLHASAEEKLLALAQVLGPEKT